MQHAHFILAFLLGVDFFASDLVVFDIN